MYQEFPAKILLSIFWVCDVPMPPAHEPVLLRRRLPLLEPHVETRVTGGGIAREQSAKMLGPLFIVPPVADVLRYIPTQNIF